MTLPPETAAFLAQLTGRHTFQTFDDRPDKDARLSRVLHDPAELATLNRQGAGIFVMVNEGDGTGRKNGNVTRIRVHCADFDGQPLPDHWTLNPSLLIESSPGKFHAYWILEDGDSPPLDSMAFNAQQEALARAVGSCPDDCKGLARVMRLPGFMHRKGEPFMTRILSSTGERFTLAQIGAAYPLPARVHPAPLATLPSVPTGPNSARRKYALAALYGIRDELAQVGEGERNKRLNAAGFRVGQLVGGGHLDSEEAQPVLWQAAAAAGLPDNEIQSTLPRALRDGMASPDPLAQVGQESGWGYGADLVQNTIWCKTPLHQNNTVPERENDLVQWCKLLSPPTDSEPSGWGTGGPGWGSEDRGGW
ncbi:DNA-primase RepB domain-containing protein [Deinococcus marmoris]|uniref:Virulence-associated protein E n=1 Tax=Deinococcus marmoris TaxID=249408 RepID=A0A1U7NX46_9DEIO|nr:DNA-primase RepB domain-containing protein [Deinococcus marmoris]OLV17489.1 virulence-associated protein E [Deinococcus marmoris]